MSSDDIVWLVDSAHGTDLASNPWLKKSALPIDASFGYSIQDLLEVEPLPQLPEGGEAYWRMRYQRALQVNAKISLEGAEEVRETCRVQVVRFASSDGRRLGGWLLRPVRGEVKRLVVMGHGYGPVPADQGLQWEETACLFFCARGFAALSTFDDLPSEVIGHVIHGIEERDQYIHGWCAEDVWCAVNALREVYPDETLPLYYYGGSFGGGIGALAVPWDSRITASYLEVPSFGNHPLRLQHPCLGSGEVVRLKYLKKPQVAETLRWFDAAATMACAVNPVMFACAILDPVVPPFGQFSIWRAHPGKKRLLVCPAGHLEYPTLEECLIHKNAEVNRWFARKGELAVW